MRHITETCKRVICAAVVHIMSAWVHHSHIQNFFLSTATQVPHAYLVGCLHKCEWSGVPLNGGHAVEHGLWPRGAQSCYPFEWLSTWYHWVLRVMITLLTFGLVAHACRELLLTCWMCAHQDHLYITHMKLCNVAVVCMIVKDDVNTYCAYTKSNRGNVVVHA